MQRGRKSPGKSACRIHWPYWTHQSSYIGGGKNTHSDHGGRGCRQRTLWCGIFFTSPNGLHG